MSKENGHRLTLRVQRYDPEKDKRPHFEEFIVPLTQGMTVLNGLLYVKENLDSTLTFRTSCRMGICGSCGMMMNSYPHLACHTQIEEFHTSKLTLKPLPNLPIIKDLVVDLTLMFNKHRTVKPYVIRQDAEEMANPTAEYAQSPGELNAFLQFSYCIKCGICVAACPTSASDRHFLGPQALAQCYRYCADSRDGGETERFAAAGSDHGVWHCHLAGACSEACPKGVDPALAIQLMKRRLMAAAFGLGEKQKPATIAAPPAESKPRLPVPEFTAGKTA